jgi:diacylglycerol kinase
MIIALEMINTSVELVCDLVEPNQNPKIKEIKDISSGAVLVFTISTFIVGCIVFIPKIMVYLKWM